MYLYTYLSQVVFIDLAMREQLQKQSGLGLVAGAIKMSLQI
ncbi:hypothetical protein ACOBV8_06170 [Pseudoalteromonas espejiana]